MFVSFLQRFGWLPGGAVATPLKSRADQGGVSIERPKVASDRPASQPGAAATGVYPQAQAQRRQAVKSPAKNNKTPVKVVAKTAPAGKTAKSAAKPAVKAPAKSPTKAAPKAVAKTPVKAVVKMVNKVVPKADATTKQAKAVKPVLKAKPVVKPATKVAATPAKAAKAVVKPAAKAVKKSPTKLVAKAAVKSPVKSVVKPAAKLPAKAAAKTSAKTASKPSVQSVAKPAAQPQPKASSHSVAAKPLSKPAAKARPVTPSAPAAKAAPVASKAVPLSTRPVAAPQPSQAAAGAPSAVKPIAPAPQPAAPTASQTMLTPPPLKPGRRSSARTAAASPPPAPMVPTHSPDAAKASYSTIADRVVSPAPHVAARKDPKLANNWKTKEANELTDEEVKAMPDTEYMNDKQLAFFRHKLSLLKQEIHASAGETTEHLREDTVVVPDPADRATIEEEHALELRTRDRERKLLKKIEQSIARIDAGDYGYCDETGEPIGVGRLIARPTASLSLEAQQRRELKQKMFGD